MSGIEGSGRTRITVIVSALLPSFLLVLSLQRFSSPVLLNPDFKSSQQVVNSAESLLEEASSSRAATKLVAHFTCHVCQKVLSTKQSLLNHVNSQHTRETKYPCTTCGRQFLHKSYLKPHMAMHERQAGQPAQPFPCTGIECKQSFPSQALLNRHGARHTHSCPFCEGAAATCRRDLNYHIFKVRLDPRACKWNFQVWGWESENLFPV